MFCEYCGKKIDYDSKFCEHCGNAILNDETKQIKTHKNPNETKILLVIILICVFGFIFYQELKYFNSPESAMNNYLKDYKDLNYDSILESLNIELNDFISPEFLKKRALNDGDAKINDFKVLGCSYNSSDSSAKCEVTYTTEKNGISTTKTYKLKRKEQKRLFLFADWIVENQDIEMLQNWMLYLPKDSKGTLEDISLESYRDEENDKTGYDAYLIPNIFKGKYNLFITTNTGLTLSTVVKVSSSSYTYHFTLKDISEDLKVEIQNIGKEIIDIFYQGIILNQVKGELVSNYEIQKILDSYEVLKKEIQTDITLKKFQVEHIKITNLDMDENGKILVTYQMQYHYEFQYKDKNEVKTHEGKSNDTFYVTIKNTDLKEIEKIDSLVSYFSKKY